MAGLAIVDDRFNPIPGYEGLYEAGNCGISITAAANIVNGKVWKEVA